MTTYITNLLEKTMNEYKAARTILDIEKARAKAEGILIALYDCKAISVNEYLNLLNKIDKA